MEEEEKFEVKDTNLEAMKAKCSAVSLGYMKDEFAQCFVNEKCNKDITINRGYWSRTTAVQQTVKNFLTKQSEDDNITRQIISLGSGYDTLYFNLNIEQDNNKYAPYEFVEIDLGSVVKEKIRYINKSDKQKASFTGELEITPPPDNTLKCKNYKLMGCDLRDLNLLTTRQEDLSSEAPTLVFTECVLAYQEHQEIESLLKLICDRFDNCQFMDYEMFNGKDRFGKMMVSNFEARGVPLLGINFFESLEGIKNNYLQNGWDYCKIYDMYTVYYNELDQNERARIEKLQWLDEFEEFWLMQRHYFMSFATKFTKKEDMVIKAIFDHSWIGSNSK